MSIYELQGGSEKDKSGMINNPKLNEREFFMSPILNGIKLKDIANASHTAQVLSTMMACRERNREFIDLRRCKLELKRAGEKIIDEEFDKFWQNCEMSGLGQIRHGRARSGGTKSSRFYLNFSVKNIGHAMLEGADIEVSRLTPEPKVAAPAPKALVVAPKAVVEKRKPGRPRSAETLNAKPKRTRGPNKTLSIREGRSLSIPFKGSFITVTLPVGMTKEEVAKAMDAVKQSV